MGVQILFEHRGSWLRVLLSVPLPAFLFEQIPAEESEQSVLWVNHFNLEAKGHEPEKIRTNPILVCSCFFLHFRPGRREGRQATAPLVCRAPKRARARELLNASRWCRSGAPRAPSRRCGPRAPWCAGASRARGATAPQCRTSSARPARLGGGRCVNLVVPSHPLSLLAF